MPGTRAARYREWEAKARRRAANAASPFLRESYARLAESWAELAAQIEAQERLTEAFAPAMDEAALAGDRGGPTIANLSPTNTLLLN